MSIKVLLAGGSGEVGQRLITRFLDDPAIKEIHSVGRRSLNLANKKLTEHSLSQSEYSLDVKNDPIKIVAICSLGTTIKKAGSKENFLAVDRDLVIHFAKAAKQSGAKHLIVMSSLGASTEAGSFYLKTKGEMESAISSSGFDQVSIIRPSLLTGDRQELRLGEVIGSWALAMMKPLLAGKLKRYRSISMDSVAKAIHVIAKRPEANTDKPTVIESDELQRLCTEPSD